MLLSLIMAIRGCIPAWVFAAIAALASVSVRAQVPVAVDEVVKTHQQTKAALTPSLPKRIDESTVLTGVRIDDVTLFYQFKVDYDKTSITPELKDALGKKARALVCRDTHSLKVMNFGGHYGFEFTDKFDMDLMRVTLSRSDCF
jgi:hypothetical protein